MYASAKIISVDKLSKNYFLASLKLLDNKLGVPKPFQFVTIWIPRKDLLPMSVADYENNILEIVFKVVGEGTEALSKNPVFVGVNGFYGRGLELSDARRVLFVAGGSGIAPLPYLAKYISSRGGLVDVVWGVKSSDELFDLSKIVSKKYLGEIHLASEDCLNNRVFCGKASELLKELISRDKWDVIIASGPKPMLNTVCRETKNLYGYGAEIYVALEAYIKCGIGFCGSCVLKPLPKLLCRDGPVFRCDEVMPHLETN
jgi:dihydroorotate dehydrogenase electron transfer subunit